MIKKATMSNKTKADRVACDICGKKLTPPRLERHKTAWSCRGIAIMLERVDQPPAGHDWADSPAQVRRLAVDHGIEFGEGIRYDRGYLIAGVWAPEWLVWLDRLRQVTGWLDRSGITKSDADVVLAYLIKAPPLERDGFAVEAALALGDDVDLWAATQVLRKTADHVMRERPDLV